MDPPSKKKSDESSKKKSEYFLGVNIEDAELTRQFLTEVKNEIRSKVGYGIIRINQLYRQRTQSRSRRIDNDMWAIMEKDIIDYIMKHYTMHASMLESVQRMWYRAPPHEEVLYEYFDRLFPGLSHEIKLATEMYYSYQFGGPGGKSAAKDIKSNFRQLNSVHYSIGELEHAKTYINFKLTKLR